MPSATIGASGQGGFPIRKPVLGMDYSQKFRTGPANFKPGRGIGVSQIMGQREGNVAARYADGTPVPYGMPINVAGYNTSGVGPGTRGYRGSGVIGSAAGALGSPGIPTSQRGRAMKYGDQSQAWQMPSWMVGQQQRNQSGLTPNWTYGGMGMLPYTSASPVGSTSPSKVKPQDSSKPQPSGSMGTPGLPQSLFGTSLGLPTSFFGTTAQDMMNRLNLIW